MLRKRLIKRGYYLSILSLPLEIWESNMRSPWQDLCWKLFCAKCGLQRLLILCINLYDDLWYEVLITCPAAKHEENLNPKLFSFLSVTTISYWWKRFMSVQKLADSISKCSSQDNFLKCSVKVCCIGHCVLSV